MSATETEAPEAAPETATPTVEAAAERPREQRFRWSAWVHYGDGALECDHRVDGACQDTSHFHAWIRLPNPFQHKDIAEKARAAKARKLRALKDEDSDPRVTLELELDRMRDARAVLVDEIVDKDFPEDYTKAIREVDGLDDESWEPDPDSSEEQKPPRLFANIDQDREEYLRQRELPEEQRDAEDFAELERTVSDYDSRVQAALASIQDPRRAALNERPVDELLDIIRKERIEHLGNESYLHVYNTWQMYVCTLKPRKTGTPSERVWSSIDAMKYQEAPEVIFAVTEAFNELETAQAESRMGKDS